MNEFETVLANPRSIRARWKLLEAWRDERDPRARLLELELRAFTNFEDHHLRNDAEALIYDGGAKLTAGIAAITTGASFQLGLISAAVVRADRFISDADKLIHTAPIIMLGITDPTDAREVVNLPALAQIVDLDFRGRGVDDELARAIAGSPYVREVRILGLPRGSITHHALDVLLRSPNLPNLISVDITGNPCQGAGTEATGTCGWYAFGQAAGPFVEKALSTPNTEYGEPQFPWPPFLNDYAWLE